MAIFSGAHLVLSYKSVWKLSEFLKLIKLYSPVSPLFTIYLSTWMFFEMPSF